MASPTLVDRTATLTQRASSSSPSAAPSSASALVSTLLPVLLYAAIFFILFLVLRRKFPRYYRPRTFVGSLPKEARTDAGTRSGIINWFADFWATPDTYVLNHHTLDGYLFLRFLKIAVVSCVVGCLITWPVLFPINATGGGGKKQLDILTMANVQNNYYKLFAHAGCAIIYFGFIIYTITRECIYFINLRQAYLTSPLYASRISSRTVLFTVVPEPYMNEARLRQVLGPGVRKVWLATDCTDLDDLVQQRDKAAFKLEGAETAMIKTANKNKRKAEKKGDVHTGEEEAAIGEGGSVAARWVTEKDRPTHRLKFFGLFGKKVDSLEWSRSELQRLIPQVDALQAQHRNLQDVKKLSSVFVEFETLALAQSAYQSLTHHQALHMAPRFIGMTPGEVIWSNLKIKWWELVVRKLATTALVTATIIFWTIPVAVIGAISNINALTNKVPFLKFILDIPPVVLGVVTGLLPVVLLAVLMALLPMYLRWMAKVGGAPTRSAVELTVQNSYFAFQVIQVFLVTTLASSAASVATKVIQDPSSATSLLANNLPSASNFYIAYFILQGLAVVANVLLAWVGLVIFYVLGKLLDSTARKMYKRWINLAGIGWGTLFPIYTNLWVIAICYAAIAPLVLGFAAIGLFLFYVAYRYNFLYVSNAAIDTKGIVYPQALKQIFVGLYFAQVCLIGLFAISTGTSIGALGPLILMILMLIFTVLYHISLNSALDPLLKYLPKTVYAEERSLLGNGEAEEQNGYQNEKTTNGNAAASASEANGANGTNGATQDHSETKTADAKLHDDPAFSAPPHKKPNLFTKWLRPDIYTDYATMRRLVPTDIAIEYNREDEEGAYYNPSITAPTPLLWVPRDPLGVSSEAVAADKSIIDITDHDATLDDKGNICWDRDTARPPIYQPVVYY